MDVHMDINFIHMIEERNVPEIKPYFRPEIMIEYCRECEYYNKIWACPPYDFDLAGLLERYQYAYIIGSKLYMNDLGESFKELLDNKNLEYVSNEIYKTARFVLDKKIVAVGKKQEHLCILLAGRCLICQNCTREKQLPCIQPEKMHLSLESIGFDVASMCQDILGEEILWAKENLPVYLFLVSAVFSKQKLDIEDIYNTINMA